MSETSEEGGLDQEIETDIGDDADVPRDPLLGGSEGDDAVDAHAGGLPQGAGIAVGTDAVGGSSEAALGGGAGDLGGGGDLSGDFGELDPENPER